MILSEVFLAIVFSIFFKTSFFCSDINIFELFNMIISGDLRLYEEGGSGEVDLEFIRKSLAALENGEELYYYA